jgi:hypothetical protein
MELVCWPVGEELYSGGGREFASLLKHGEICRLQNPIAPKKGSSSFDRRTTPKLPRSLEKRTHNTQQERSRRNDRNGPLTCSYGKAWFEQTICEMFWYLPIGFFCFSNARVEEARVTEASCPCVGKDAAQTEMFLAVVLERGRMWNA